MKPTLADSGWTALAALKRAKEQGDPVSLLLLDAQMPGMDGFTLAAKIQQDRDLPDLHRDDAHIGRPARRLRRDAARSEFPLISTKPVRQLELREAMLKVLGMQKEKTEDQKLVTRHSLREARRQLRVLLAEDNAINRELAVRLLSKRGHSVTVAENGKQAVAAVETETFDVVLMDVQMPEMDGFEATAAIRQWSSERQAHSDHRHDGARDEGRPRALSRGRHGCLHFQADPVRRTPRSHGIFVRLRALRQSRSRRSGNLELALARVGGDQVLLADLARIFCDQCPRLLVEVQGAVGRKNLVDLKRAAHSLRSAIATFAAQEATDAAAKLEGFSRPEDFDSAPEALRNLESNVARLQQSLESFVGAQIADGVAPPVQSK